ncbi:hypothetical protein [Rickettsiales endosymbiont of Stachyamoeba lipophora]|uniref:hypothetical protein n=1 Tax=Rickettsiales endosymbiont of Stachyamoeba lipophora TaxID=2486578 RepID=UPI000F64E274|nr:hypothetical protein [Rickettsiales endosymbiont of Stachyamoeba lipophora]AZL16038.1 hypothetical protein EF513_05750 [Rickettsiales endosymbiont of Stachyamoeba lipophora]
MVSINFTLDNQTTTVSFSDEEITALKEYFIPNNWEIKEVAETTGGGPIIQFAVFRYKEYGEFTSRKLWSNSFDQYHSLAEKKLILGSFNNTENCIDIADGVPSTHLAPHTVFYIPVNIFNLYLNPILEQNLPFIDAYKQFLTQDILLANLKMYLRTQRDHIEPKLLQPTEQKAPDYLQKLLQLTEQKAPKYLQKFLSSIEHEMRLYIKKHLYTAHDAYTKAELTLYWIYVHKSPQLKIATNNIIKTITSAINPEPLPSSPLHELFISKDKPAFNELINNHIEKLLLQQIIQIITEPKSPRINLSSSTDQISL